MPPKRNGQTSKKPSELSEWKRYNGGGWDTKNKHWKKTKFMQTRDYTSESLPLPELTGTRHKIFKFRKSDQFSPEDIAAIEQSCLLATHWLNSGALDHYYRAVMLSNDSGWRLWNDGKKNVGYEYLPSRLDPDRSISDKDKREIRDLFETKLTDAVSIAVDWTKNENASTLLDDNLQNIKYQPGLNSVIWIPRAKINRLKEAQKAPVDVPLLLCLRFEFAITLVHELAHAIQFWKSGKLREGHRDEPYFGPNILSEAGFELESWLFDGHLTRIWQHPPEDGGDDTLLFTYDGKPSGLRGVPVMWDWPYQGVVEDYRKSHALGVRVEPKMINALDRAWRVELDFMHKFFTNDFWADPKDQFAFQPPREVGYRFRRADKYLIPVDTEITDKYVPESYIRLPLGEIVPDKTLAEPQLERGLIKRRFREFVAGTADIPSEWQYGDLPGSTPPAGVDADQDTHMPDAPAAPPVSMASTPKGPKSGIDGSVHSSATRPTPSTPRFAATIPGQSTSPALQTSKKHEKEEEEDSDEGLPTKKRRRFK